ncbi:SLC13 family permease [Pseudoroseomonas cervicalis]|uniref:SLC13 family permease n=1 Tax=Teichococcus cervicalis TaxID=204525 RepID=UPI00277DAB66|nr:SLC13 family permease [Pseudoroseomonas cervicalis]MDQ1077942.1 di/tricarboxylate transporter [Pseudoroseomonas cervicalis]
MSPALASTLGLVVMFVLGTALPINMGALAFALAFLIGVFAVGMSANAILQSFPGDLFVTLVGITYLFAIAQKNGTIDLLVHWAVRAVGGRIAAIPWVMFCVAALLTAIGAVSPAAVAIIAPIALRFARHYNIDPLMMGLIVVHGAQGGGFSPISIYGGITNQIVQRAGLPGDEMALFLASLIFNLLVSIALFFVFGGARLLGRRDGVAHAEFEEGGRASLPVRGHGGTPAAPRNGEPHGAPELDRDRLLTLIGLLVLGVGSLGFGLNVGMMAITVAVALALLSPHSQKGAIDKVSWSTVLLIAGVITYVGVLQTSGAIDMVSNGVAGLGTPLLAALLLCYIGGVVSAFASSTGVLGAIIPLAVPFLAGGEIGAVGMVAALAISSTIVDVSPFSTNGALVLANAPEGEREKLFRRFLIYSGLVVVAGPLLAWAALILPGWL